MAAKSEPNHQAVKSAGSAYAAVVITAIILGVLFTRVSPLPAAPVDAPENQFSAGRALQFVEQIIPHQKPHLTGTPENAAVRKRIVDQFTALGYRPEVHRHGTVTPRYMAAVVHNIVVKIPGKNPDNAVVLLSHYDSVGASPGIADDAHAVGITLEIARWLADQPQPENSVIFLITDGEELGLLGAYAFVQHHSLDYDGTVGVINMEARGTGGPSLMFQTGPDSAWLVDGFLRNTPKPIASSLMPALYEILPNDTDLTAFINSGYPGLNFAFVEHPARYHTPNDSLAYLEADAVQHQGENALAALAYAMNRTDIPEVTGSVVFFDIAGYVIISWPGWLSLPLAIVSFLLLVVVVARMINKGRLEGRALFWALCFVPLALAAAAYAGVGLNALLQLATGSSSPWAAYPGFTVIMLCLAAAGIIAVVAILFFRFTGFKALLSGVYIWFALLALISATLLPGASYLFTVPALLAGISMLAAQIIDERKPFLMAWFSLIPLVGVLFLHLVVLKLATHGLGPELSQLFTFFSGLIMLSFVPLFVLLQKIPRVLCIAVIVVGSALFFVAASVAPPFDTDNPHPTNYTLFFDTDTDEHRWYYWPEEGPMTEQLSSAGLLHAGDYQHPTTLSGAWKALNIDPGLPPERPPVAVILADEKTDEGKRVLTLRIVSPRAAPLLHVYLPAELAPEQVSLPEFGSYLQWPERRTGGSLSRFRLVGIPEEGLVVKLLLPTTDAFQLTLVDTIPVRAESLMHEAMRRPDTVSPVHTGDVVHYKASYPFGELSP